MNFGKSTLLVCLFLIASQVSSTAQTQTEAEAAIMKAHEIFSQPGLTDEALAAYKAAFEVSSLDRDKVEVGRGIQSCAVSYFRDAQKLEMQGELELAKMKHKMAYNAFLDGEPILAAEKVNPVLQYYTAISAININKNEEAIVYLETLRTKDAKPAVYHFLFLAYQKVERKKAKQVLNEGIQKYPEDENLIKDAQMVLGIFGTGK